MQTVRAMKSIPYPIYNNGLRNVEGGWGFLLPDVLWNLQLRGSRRFSRYKCIVGQGIKLELICSAASSSEGAAIGGTDPLHLDLG